ncbi:MAG: ammonium transporter, partial [Candidatus Omnitrophica bacterium]|nr:ammonium transporter [Candidatus Omnitrophota bacterium]
KRVGYPKMGQPPHNLPFTVIGAALLWFGWFGFNAGSSLAADGIAAIAFATTNTAAATAGLTWAMLEWIFRGKPTVLGAATGAVAGLVAITPGAGFVSVPSALAIGFGASVICYIGLYKIKSKFGYDDSLDVFGVHGLGGTWGALATGLFCSTSINPNGADGLFFGNPGQFLIQVIGVAAGYAIAIVGTLVCLGIVRSVTSLRVSREEEISGLDYVLHGEVAYNLLSQGMSDASRTEEY